MSFLSFLSPAITAASQVAGGYEQGKQRVAQEQIAQAVLAQKQKRQDTIDALNARNITSEINTREHPTDKSIHIDQDGNAWREEGGALVPVTTGQPNSATAPAPTAAGTGGPAGDINLGMNTSGPTKASDQGPAVAPPSQGQQGSTAQPQTAPQGNARNIGAPKFGPRPPNPATIPNTPEWKAAKVFEAKTIAANRAPPPGPTNVYLPSVDPKTGATVYTVVPNKGTVSPEQTNIVKPGIAGAGAGGNAEQTKKAEQFGLGLNSLGDVISGMEKRQFKAPNMMTGPMTAEARNRGTLGEMAQGGLNLLDPGLAELSGSQNLFMSAAAHSVGGARITPEQIAMFTSGYTARTDDPPELVKKKLVRSVDFLNAAAAVLPPDMVKNQLAQVSPETMQLLKRYGFGKAPSTAAQGAVAQIIDATGGGNAATGDINLGATPAKGGKADPTASMSDADAWEYHVSHGMTKPQATAAVKARHGQ